MVRNILNKLSTPKYERLLPRVFPGAVCFEIRDLKSTLVWRFSPGSNRSPAEGGDDDHAAVWSEFGAAISRRQLPDSRLQFRAPLLSREFGKLGWLAVTYDVQPSQPMSAAPEPLKRAFADATVVIQEEIELQAECDQLASELMERYEELNLVYSTKDQVEYFDEGQEALVRLVHNCADYLDVALAALICRDRNLRLESSNDGSVNNEEIIELLSTNVYDYVEAQISSLVLNAADDPERERLFGRRAENLLAYPIVDDHGSVIGLLAVITHKDRHTFSNGDRNLLEVMAKKASRIIHTHHDSLTGLMNRNGFESTLVNMLANSRSNNVQHTLLHIDLDQLHVINDLMGHEVGDNLIRRIARSLRGVLRDSDYLARLGGDEFGVLLTNCGIKHALKIADKVRTAIRDLKVVSAKRQLDVSSCVGIASMTPDSEGIVRVMAAAEIACKAAKESGRDRVQVFAKDNTTLVRRSEEIEWIARVQQALRDDHFLLHCQPIEPLLDKSREPHYEVLVRMLGDDDEILAPGLFMPAAERYQLMPMVDRWVLRHTIRLLRRHWTDIASVSPVFCINLSGQSLTNPGFEAFVADTLEKSGIPAANICFEITETAAISNIDEALAFMGRLREVGCRFALDDFGAGLSSFGYLKVLPVDYLKIDGSFVQEVTRDDVSHAMVSSICQIGRTMGLSLVAEFVNDDATIDVLSRIGVDYVQGFGIGKPVALRGVVQELGVKATAARA